MTCLQHVASCGLLLPPSYWHAACIWPGHRLGCCAHRSSYPTQAITLLSTNTQSTVQRLCCQQVWNSLTCSTTSGPQQQSGSLHSSKASKCRVLRARSGGGAWHGTPSATITALLWHVPACLLISVLCSVTSCLNAARTSQLKCARTLQASDLRCVSHGTTTPHTDTRRATPLHHGLILLAEVAQALASWRSGSHAAARHRCHGTRCGRHHRPPLPSHWRPLLAAHVPAARHRARHVGALHLAHAHAHGAASLRAWC